MRLRAEQLQQHLTKDLLKVYLVSGDEELLVQEACDAIRARAREAGCQERQLLQVEGKFDWNALLASSAEMSLFAESKLIELRLPSGKPGTEGSKALTAYVDGMSADNILLIIAGKIDRASTNTRWFKALDKVGGVIQVWPVDARELPRWLQHRVEEAGLRIDQDALQLLCERVEGNLLAAVQEIEKLRLRATDQQITVELVLEGVADNARYNLFALVDEALLGNASGALKMLQGLHSEGTEAPVILWALSREIRLLYQCRTAVDRGKPPQQALRDHRVWDKRIPIVSAALKRHDLAALGDLLHGANLADQSIKGLADGKPWDHLDRLVLTLSQGRQGALAIAH